MSDPIVPQTPPPAPESFLTKVKTWWATFTLQPVLERLQNYAEKMKDILLYIVAPLLILIYYVESLRNRALARKEIEDMKKDQKDIASQDGLIKELEKESKDAEDDYRASRDRLD